MASKISKPYLYGAAVVVVGAVAFVLTEPETVTKKSKPKLTKTETNNTQGFTPEDYTASFPRYTGKPRNAFAPKVISKKGQTATALVDIPEPGTERLTETWNLTGIALIDGTRNALIENGTDSAFLKVGDTWNGLRVVAIEATAVRLIDPLGKESRIRFVEPTDEKPLTVTSVAPLTGTTSTVGVAPVTIPTPGPLPVINSAAPPTDDRNARRQARRAGRAGEQP